jgi:formamidopyrimidine-DNA glycosylase
MPELPEVETVRRGITPILLNQCIKSITIRQPKLRYPIPSHLTKTLPGLHIHSIKRRSKYLLLETELGHLIIHLGMSGRIHTLDSQTPTVKHDHVDIHFTNGICLRYHDPRRFGMILWTPEDPKQHSLLCRLGPEPLTKKFDGDHLFKQSQKRHISVKQFIMDSKVVVGVGNIYASESLFQAGISPKKPANKISKLRYELLADHIKTVLKKAIKAGGTTLKDFSTVDGNPGYFQQELFVYGRDNQNCLNCENKIKKITQAQRSTFYCPNCQHQ